jgi:hypothetical protein
LPGDVYLDKKGRNVLGYTPVGFVLQTAKGVLLTLDPNFASALDLRANIHGDRTLGTETLDVAIREARKSIDLCGERTADHAHGEEGDLPHLGNPHHFRAPT